MQDDTSQTSDNRLGVQPVGVQVYACFFTSQVILKEICISLLAARMPYELVEALGAMYLQDISSKIDACYMVC